MDIPGDEKKHRVVINQRRSQHKTKKIFSKKLRYLLPSVVDIFGAEIKRAVVTNKKRIQH